ncbi:serine/threonine-protein kinase [Kamptonema formosum]|uniref:serine/threonine-protein kinase n=1 Tax=Kamptonema formosum TaxID=331992 RepID=UPI00035F51E5|nr:serine/threonine-protein kinase [Oscillatoria sp. PCC 10802]
MSYCLNPSCSHPQNPEGARFCHACGCLLPLKERYRAIRQIGEGGFGRTFLAVDEDRLNSRCVIKQFFPQFQGTTALQKATELFNREAVRLHELGEHPQIPDLLAFFEQDKRLYLVQEFIDGPNLLQELRERGAFSELQIRQLLEDLLPVLQFIHERKVIHRDIKPENILRRQKNGQLVLVDFGVASSGAGTALAPTGTRAGTQGYAPMEQMRGGAAFPASDLYSLAVTCLVLLAASVPDDLFDPLEGEWIWRENLAKSGKVVSPRLGQILDKMLQYSVRDRYQSAAEVLAQLNPAKAGTPHPPAPPKVTPATPAPRHPQPATQPPPPTSTSRPKSQAPAHNIDMIAAELASVKTQVSQAQPAPPNAGAPAILPPAPTPAPPQKPPAGGAKSPQGKSKSAGSDIDADLESLRSEYFPES